MLGSRFRQVIFYIPCIKKKEKKLESRKSGKRIDNNTFASEIETSLRVENETINIPLQIDHYA